MQWLLEGNRMYQAEGLGTAPRLEQAKAEYWDRQDPVGEWLSSFSGGSVRAELQRTTRGDPALDVIVAALFAGGEELYELTSILRKEAGGAVVGGCRGVARVGP